MVSCDPFHYKQTDRVVNVDLYLINSSPDYQLSVMALASNRCSAVAVCKAD